MFFWVRRGFILINLAWRLGVYLIVPQDEPINASLQLSVKVRDALRVDICDGRVEEVRFVSVVFVSVKFSEQISRIIIIATPN